MNIKKGCLSVIFIILCLVFILMSGSLFALPVDLNTFTSNPSESVDISMDGSSAILYEDMWIAPVSLEKEGFFIPSDASSLSFDYELNVPVDNNDYFYFYIKETSTPVFWAGGPEGIYSGTFTYDISSLAGQAVPVFIIFDLMPDDWELQSKVTVSNVNIHIAADTNDQDPNSSVSFNVNLSEWWNMISVPKGYWILINNVLDICEPKVETTFFEI